VPHHQQIGLSVFGAQRFHLVQFLRQGFLEILCVERRPANRASHKIHGHYFVPFSLEKAFEFHGALGADPPAIAAPGAKAHIVQELSLVSLVRIVESACRAILHTSQTPVTPLVYTKKAYHLLLFRLPLIAFSNTPSQESAAEPGSFPLCALTLKPVKLHILQGFWLADLHALWLSIAKLTFVRKAEVLSKGH
jgi:hypothetical protein